MEGAYDDRDGKIWLDGKLVEWRDAQVHVLTHALHYASSVFEGERAYNGKIFLGHEHSERLHFSAGELDFQIPFTADEIDASCSAIHARLPMATRRPWTVHLSPRPATDLKPFGSTSGRSCLAAASVTASARGASSGPYRNTTLKSWYKSRRIKPSR